MNEERSLDAYLITDLLISYNFNKIGPFNQIGLFITINNLLGIEYVNNAWVYHFISEGYDPTIDDDFIFANTKENHYTMAGYFPQATRYILAGLKIRL